MKILIVLAHNRLTGVNNFALTLSKVLSNDGYEVDVLIDSENRDYTFFVKDYNVFTDEVKEYCNNLYINEEVDYGKYNFSILSYPFHQIKIKQSIKIYITHGTEFIGYRPNRDDIHWLVGTSETSYKMFKCDSLIRNYIDLEVYKPAGDMFLSRKKPMSALYLSRYNLPEALYYACHIKGVKLDHVKFTPKIYDLIKMYDFVISHGRGAYEAMACGKPTLIMNSFGCIDGELRIDGWVKEDNIDKLLQRNASGFTLDVKAKTIDDFEKFIDTYNYKDGITNRKLAEEKLSANTMLTKFKEIFNEFSILT